MLVRIDPPIVVLLVLVVIVINYISRIDIRLLLSPHRAPLIVIIAVRDHLNRCRWRGGGSGGTVTRRRFNRRHYGLIRINQINGIMLVALPRIVIVVAAILIVLRQRIGIVMPVIGIRQLAVFGVQYVGARELVLGVPRIWNEVMHRRSDRRIHCVSIQSGPKLIVQSRRRRRKHFPSVAAGCIELTRMARFPVVTVQLLASIVLTELGILVEDAALGRSVHIRVYRVPDPVHVHLVRTAATAARR